MDKNTWIGLLIAALSIVFVLSQGAEKSPGKLETLEKATMQVHDEAMKEMADMNRISRSLKTELVTLDSLNPHSQAIRMVLKQMEQAEAGMMGWMQQYKAPVGQPEAEAERYFEQQKDMIEKNYREIRQAVEAGKELQGN